MTLPMKRSASPRRTRVKRTNPKRKAAEFARCYGSKVRVAFVQSLPCAACGVVGYSENAHVGREGRGGSRRANADQIAPLCGRRPYNLGTAAIALYRGCHQQFDTHASGFAAHFDPDVACAQTEAAWQARTVRDLATDAAREHDGRQPNG